MALIRWRHRAGVTIVLVMLLAVGLFVGLFVVMPFLVGRGPHTPTCRLGTTFRCHLRPRRGREPS